MQSRLPGVDVRREQLIRSVKNILDLFVFTKLAVIPEFFVVLSHFFPGNRVNSCKIKKKITKILGTGCL